LPFLFHRAETLWADKELISVAAGRVRRTTYGAWAERTRRLGSVLDRLGISDGGRVATLAANTARHLELYFAVPCTGRVLHTLNARLSAEQLVYIAAHAQDEVVFVDSALLGILRPILEGAPSIRTVVIMEDGSEPGEAPPVPGGVQVLDYEELLAEAGSHAFGGIGDEGTAASMCYTSGTTGTPKGVVYSHRSIVLHSMASLMVDANGVSESDVVLPVVPMFHANAWGLCHAAVFAGSRLVLPGPDLSVDAIARLVREEGVSLAAAVPTIWIGVLPLLAKGDVPRLRRILSGGSAVPVSLIASYRTKLGVPLTQAWGMTETSPLATVARLRADVTAEDPSEIDALHATQGIAAPGVEVRIADIESGLELANDGKVTGELQVRGPWVAAGYHRAGPFSDPATPDGWLRTGDVATIDTFGYVRLVDRIKDLVKSGGEWISSVELENHIMGHPAVVEAAVVAVPDEKWLERPLACVVLRSDSDLTADALREYLAAHVPKWWLPERIEFLNEIPKTSVGKFSKATLREQFGTPTVR
jgi:fatty-acyl-CoA synthase